MRCLTDQEHTKLLELIGELSQLMLNIYQPTEDEMVPLRKSRWVHDEKSGPLCHCENCGTSIYYERLPKYCCGCGAMMTGEVEYKKRGRRNAV